jgi:hypothetical protein
MTRGLPRSFVTACLAGALVALVALLALAIPLCVATPAARAQTVAHGIADVRLGSAAAADQEAWLDEIGGPLNATWVRVDCDWTLGEPARGAYDAVYLAGVQHAVEYAHGLGLNVLVTVCYVPRWASDSSYWDDPPYGFAKGYRPFYPIDATALDDFQSFAQYLATTFNGEVQAYECWNEPNLWPFLYPQETRRDGDFAAHTYAKYVKYFSQGVRAGDPAALVVAGATAPGGGDDQYRSGPLQFARAFKASATASYFEVYSHHPYVMGGVSDMDPAKPPQHPSVTVGLSNIGPLLDVFPGKPFYLTEYGFSTTYSYAFGAGISEIDQARFLKKAYALAAKHAQIKILFWYLLFDYTPNGNPSSPAGVYTGLRRVGGGAKRSWYAFARGNALTLIVPATAGRGQTLRLHGQLTCEAVGGVKGADLTVQRRSGTTSWKTLRTIQSGDGGYYKTWVTFKGTCRYRVVWRGVVTSLTRAVRRR